MNDNDGTTCWESNKVNKTPCKNEECRLWLECKEKQNALDHNQQSLPVNVRRTYANNREAHSE